MSNSKMHFKVGLFTLCAIFIAMAGMVAVSGGEYFKKKEPFLLVFDGSVQGLKAGAAVTLKGVQIGEVKSITAKLSPQSLDIVNLVPIELDYSRIEIAKESKHDAIVEELITKGLRAQLKTQSLLTGLLYVDLDFHPHDEARYFKVASKFTQLPTIPTDLEKLSRSLENLDIEKLVENISNTAKGVDELVNNADIRAAIKNTAEFTADMHDLVTSLHEQIRANSSDVKQLVGNLNNLSQTLNDDIPAISDDIKSSLDAFKATNDKLYEMVSEAEFILSDESPAQREFIETMQTLEATSRAIEQLAKTIERKPESVLRGK